MFIESGLVSRGSWSSFLLVSVEKVFNSRGLFVECDFYCGISRSLPLGSESSFGGDFCLCGSREVMFSVGWSEGA